MKRRQASSTTKRKPKKRRHRGAIAAGVIAGTGATLTGVGLGIIHHVNATYRKFMNNLPPLDVGEYKVTHVTLNGDSSRQNCVQAVGIDIGTRIGKGLRGGAFAASSKTDKGVVKVVQLSNDRIHRYFKREAYMTKQASEAGAGPKVYHQAWRCGDNGFLFIEKVPLSFKRGVRNFGAQKAGEAIGETLRKCTDARLVHYDLHRDNIMFRENGEAVFIDWEAAHHYKDKSPAEIAVLLTRSKPIVWHGYKSLPRGVKTAAEEVLRKHRLL